MPSAHARSTGVPPCGKLFNAADVLMTYTLLVVHFGVTMKGSLIASTLVVALLPLGCGVLSPELTSISVSPRIATAPASSHGTATFSAVGTFSDQSSRTLTQADGLSWGTADNSIATITNTGTATCMTADAVTITASASSGMSFTLQTGSLTGSALLTCR
jgi:hypothetical protein